MFAGGHNPSLFVNCGSHRFGDAEEPTIETRIHGSSRGSQLLAQDGAGVRHRVQQVLPGEVCRNTEPERRSVAGNEAGEGLDTREYLGPKRPRLQLGSTTILLSSSIHVGIQSEECCGS